jgi:DNA end-binding protein Ku
MYYADEIREPEDAPAPQVRAAEVEMAKTLIENLAAKWEPTKYHDRYRNQLLDLLEKKADGESLPEPTPDEGGEVVDLMEALRRSVAQTKKTKKRKTVQRKTAQRKTAAKRQAS